MKLKEITARIAYEHAQIEKAVSLRNYERALRLELALYKDVLEFVAANTSSPSCSVFVAHDALRTQDVRFTR